MAVDVCSIYEVPISPRISFSHDLDDDDDDPDIKSDSASIRSDQFLLSSPTFDFDFNTTSTFTPADELFSNGKILPTQIKIKNPNQTIQFTLTDHPNPKSNKISDTHKKRLKEFIFHDDIDHQEEDEVKSTLNLKSSFWQFRRSASLNCDNNNSNNYNGKGSKGLFRSLSLKSLSRSNSTGSALNPKRNSGLKTMEKSKDLRRSSSSSSHVYYSYQNSNNSKNCKGGIRIIPILNIPPAYNISKGTISFFGFGSLFCNGKAKKKTK